MDQHARETDSEIKLFSTDQLAIGHAADADGKPRMTIQLDVNPLFGLANCQAVFDEVGLQWKLVTSGQSTFGVKQAPTYLTGNRRRLPRTNSDQKFWYSNLPRTPHNDYFLNEVDWTATPLGPMEDWPLSLQTSVSIALAESQAAVVYWGPDFISLFNSYMLEIVSTRLQKPHVAMGWPFRLIWPELWPDFQPMFKSIADSGKALDTIATNLFPTRDNFLEETFWDGTSVPIRADNGENCGFYSRARETTREVIQERRTKTLNAIAAPRSEDYQSIWDYVFQALRENDRDFPMAFGYTAEDDPPISKCILSLKQTIGLPPSGHPLVPDQVDLYGGTSGYAPLYRRAKAEKHAIILHQSDNTLASELLEGFRWAGFGEKSRTIAIIPIAASDRLLGVLVVGLNPRRPFDADYEGFMKIFAQQVAGTIATVLDREEYQRRAIRLENELENSEKQIRDLAEYGPLGILRIAPNGKIAWANPQFYEITGHPRDAEKHYELSFLDVVDPEEIESTAKLWLTLVQEQKAINVAVRLKRKWKPPPGPDNVESKEENMWALANAFPVIEDGQVTSIRAGVTDITTYKWAEAVQGRIASAAKEAKKLQENFIDVVSHEMRNPLSAITQLAESISGSIEELETGKTTLENCRNILESNVESGNTILLCAAHQKRIIDDVLTLSKLDSMMLSITPVAVQPRVIVESALQMFKAEFDTSSITIESVLDESYLEHSIDWVYLDPSRLTQVFINLISNAIKFTKLEANRHIKIKIGASLVRPRSLPGMIWFPTKEDRKDLTKGPEWGNEEAVYLWYEVADTGKGLEEEETTRLFNRFQQATAKTHIKYGGSGLGLFISRELTETQGGEIGVVSKPGQGSTFAFYVKGRRANAPAKPAKFLAEVETAKLNGRSSPKEQILMPSQFLVGATPMKLRLLLVEDNLVNAKVLSKQLAKAGCKVDIANHGMEALDCLAKTRTWRDLKDDDNAIEYDCILMDVEMPVMDGLTATRRIRQLEKEGKLLKHISIIATTANAREEQMQQTFQAGADAVQPKPFRVQELLHKIGTMRLQND